MDIGKEYAPDVDPRDAKREMQEYELALANIRTIMGHPGFHELIKKVLDFSNFNGNSYSSDIQEMAYREGRRSMGTDILGLLEDCDPMFYPELLMKWAKESIK